MTPSLPSLFSLQLNAMEVRIVSLKSRLSFIHADTYCPLIFLKVAMSEQTHPGSRTLSFFLCVAPAQI